MLHKHAGSVVKVGQKLFVELSKQIINENVGFFFMETRSAVTPMLMLHKPYCTIADS